MILISVIIPTYNNPVQLERAVLSVLNQSYRNIEIIIVNDGSTISYDDVLSKIIKKSTDIKIRYFVKNNEGPGKARQLGLNKSKGKFIQYLDSDDELLPNKLEIQKEILKSHPNVVMTYSLTMINNNPKHIHRYKNEKKSHESLLEEVLKVRKWHTSACLWHYEVGDYWSNIYNGEDVLHDFTVGLKTRKGIVFSEQILSNINIENTNRLSNVSNNEEKLERFVKDTVTINLKMYNDIKKNGLLETDYLKPLSERFFHAAARINLCNYKDESITLINYVYNMDKTLFRFIEVVVFKMISSLNIKYRRKLFRRFYDIRRKIRSSNLHQFRYI